MERAEIPLRVQISWILQIKTITFICLSRCISPVPFYLKFTCNQFWFLRRVQRVVLIKWVDSWSIKPRKPAERQWKLLRKIMILLAWLLLKEIKFLKCGSIFLLKHVDEITFWRIFHFILSVASGVLRLALGWGQFKNSSTYYWRFLEAESVHFGLCNQMLKHQFQQQWGNTVIYICCTCPRLVSQLDSYGKGGGKFCHRNALFHLVGL